MTTRKVGRKANGIGEQTITLRVNGKALEMPIGSRPGEVEPFHTLSHTIR